MMTSVSVRARTPHNNQSNLTILVRCIARQPCLPIRRIPVAQLHTTPIVAKKKKPWTSKSNSPTPSPPQNSTPSNPPAQSTPPPSNPSQLDPTAPESSNTTTNSSSEQPTDEKKPDTYDTLLNDPKYKAYRGKQTQGVVTWPTVAIFLVVGTGLFFYFQYEKERMTRLRNPLRQSGAHRRHRGGKQGGWDTESRWAV
jgi:hypothetical protein